MGSGIRRCDHPFSCACGRVPSSCPPDRSSGRSRDSEKRSSCLRHGGGGAARAAVRPRSAPGVRGGGCRGGDRRRVCGVGLRARPRRPLRGRADRGGVSLRAPVRRGEPRGRRAGRPARVGPQRRSLADALRAHVELDRTPRSPATVRCATAPVVRGLGEHYDVVERIAASFERGACDPRAIIQVERLLTMPPAATLPGEGDPAELGRRLHRIARLLEAGP